MKFAAAVPLLIFLACVCARAEEPGDNEMIPKRAFPDSVQQAPKKDDTPLILRWMIKPLKRGMWIRLPIMDTDPNRGVTFGVMPIWVLQGEKDDRIREIHAPSVTLNKNFKVTPTYRYYFYPAEDAALLARASVGKYENEVIGQYEDGSFQGTPYDIFLRVQHNVDAGQRFFGFGPDSPKSGEANYRESMFQYRVSAGHPVREGSKWRARLSNHLQASKLTNGPIPNLEAFEHLYPAQASGGRQQTNEWRASLGYDSRDHGVTTGKGEYLDLFAESSIRGFASSYDYNRWGTEGRVFLPWASDPNKVFAIQTKLEQITGTTPPFWLQSRLGGKYSLRAYGDGRYVDRGMAFVNAEQRFLLFDAKMAGVTTEFQLAPFVGAGAVFDSPEKVHRKFVRPVFGSSLRAVAKPQVVGSLDFGVGREGLAVFMDINYSF
ncbi:MAG: BamA/TamA family outer membrane protein [Elusimicrobia bacterium]|nr:BamA/TamA family outer membrane protein [Elusimicrobiota bacterium]